MMFRVVLLVTLGVVRVSKCADVKPLSLLPPLPAEIEKRFKTTLASTSMLELNTGESNQSSKLPEEDHTFHLSFPTEEANTTEIDHGIHHGHHHHHHNQHDSHDHARSGKMELSPSDDDDLSGTAAHQDFANTTHGREKEEAVHDHDEKESLMSTANPLHDADTVEMENSRRDSVDSLRQQNSEKDDKDARSGSFIAHSCGNQVLAITLLFVLLLA